MAGRKLIWLAHLSATLLLAESHLAEAGGPIMHGGIAKAIHVYRKLACVLVAGLILLAFAADVRAQLLRGRLRQQEPEIEAFAGEPYGVRRWTVQLPAGVNPALLGNNAFPVAEKNGRITLQALQAEPLRT